MWYTKQWDIFFTAQRCCNARGVLTIVRSSSLFDSLVNVVLIIGFNITWDLKVPLKSEAVK